MPELHDALKKEPKIKEWREVVKNEWPPPGMSDGKVDTELNGMYAMWQKLAKDRKWTAKERKYLEKEGKDPDKMQTGEGDDVLTKEEFIKSFQKKVTVKVNGKKEKVVVRNVERLFEITQQGKKDDRVSIQEFIDLMLMIRSKDPDKKLALSFAMCDTNRSGSLDKNEVHNMLMTLVTAEDETERRKISSLLTQEWVLDAEGNPVLDAAGNKKPGLLDTLIKKADGEWEGSMEAMTASGKGDGKLTLEELKRGLGDCGWMEEYLGRKVTRVEVTNSAFSGRSSFCSVM